MKGASVMNNENEFEYLDLEKEVVIFDGERLAEERVVQLGEELIAEFYRQKGIVIEKEE
jgi:hypothetical protein